MSWQEELRKLDEELAAGRLSADDYRVRRDQVLSSAVTHGDDAGSQQQPQQAQQQPQQGAAQQPGQQPQQQPPAPQQPNQGGDANSTQVIAPVTPPPGQPAQQPQGGQANDPERTQAVQPADAEATQAVQPVAPQPPYQQPHASPAGGFQQPHASPAAGFAQPQQPWNAPEADQSPPWGGEFPPVSPGNAAEWGQGPDDAFDSESKGGKGKIIAIVAAVVLLAGIATGAFFLFGSDDQPQADDKGNTQQQGGGNGGDGGQSAEPAPEEDMPLEGQEGTQESGTELDSWDKIPDINLLNDDELKAYQGAAPGEAKYGVYGHGDGNTTLVLMIKVADQKAASRAVGELRDIQLKNGQKSTSVNGVPSSVQVTEVEKKKDQPATMRAHYLSGDVLVRVEGVSQEGKLDDVRDKFEGALKTQLENLPADE